MTEDSPDEPDVSALIEQLASEDFRLRQSALAALVAAGEVAVGPLSRLLRTPEGPARVAAVRALADIADARSAEDLHRLLDDPDEQVRSHAARGLARVGDPRAPEALIRTIDDFPDVLRAPDTPSTDALIEMGVPALPGVVELMEAPGTETRERAFMVLRRVVEERLPGASWERLSGELGPYDPRGDASVREAAAKRWRDWVRGVEGGADG